MLTALLAAALLTAQAPAPAAPPASDPHAGHGHSAPAAAPTPAETAPEPTPVPRTDRLPASDPNAEAALKSSPRHGEYVEIKLPPGSAASTMTSWVVYPERKDKAGVVIVIYDIRGLGTWIRAVADQLAKDGFIAIVPDLIDGFGPNGGGTDTAASEDDVVKLVRAMTPEDTLIRLNAARDYAKTIPAANGKTASLGFCWGGSASFSYATAQPGLNAAVVFYGTSPEAPALAGIKAPVLGLYGSDDARVNVTIPPAEAEMKKLGKTYEVHTYEGAGHGFLRSQEGREGANYKATQQAWPRVVGFLGEHLK